MIDPKLKEYLDDRMKTMKKRSETLLDEIKKEILEKIDERFSQFEERVIGSCATKEELKSLEQRVVQLEA